ncbi:MAG TPA: hypothetical protein VGL33_32020, partial [Streptosporangiaceae bacterium]
MRAVMPMRGVVHGRLPTRSAEGAATRARRRRWGRRGGWRGAGAGRGWRGMVILLPGRSGAGDNRRVPDDEMPGYEMEAESRATDRLTL